MKKSVLIVKRDKLGDLILTSTLVSEIRRTNPDYLIDIWAPEFLGMVFDSSPDVRYLYKIWKIRSLSLKSIVIFLRYVREVFLVRKNLYEVVFIGGGEYSPRAILQGGLARYKSMVAYCPEDKKKNHPSLTHPICPTNEGHEAWRICNLLYQYASVAKQFSSRDITKLNPRIFWSRSVLVQRAAFLFRYGLCSGRYAVIGLGARKAKRQPTARQVVRWSLWLEGVLGLRVLLSFTPKRAVDVGYPDDEELVAEVLSAAPNIIPLGGALDEAIGVISAAAVAIMPDSGLMHAATTGENVVVIGLFADLKSSPSPTQWGPTGKLSAHLIGERNIGDISDEQLFSTIQDILGFEEA